MTKKEQAFFQTLRTSLLLNNSTGQSINVDDWSALFSEMKEQAVAALPLYYLRENPIPDQDLQKE